MNVGRPLTVMVALALALVLGWQEVVHDMSSDSVTPRYNRRPCERNPDNNAYDKFVRRHILQESFNVSSRCAWKTYLNRWRLCNRTRQSFIRKSDRRLVLQICNGSGRRLSSRNLCISHKTMLVYDVRVGNGCKVEKMAKGRKYVIVACDKIGNFCRPVHFERNNNRRPDRRAKHCRLRAHHQSDI